MKDYMTLKILDKMSSIFLALGINYQVMRKILQVKFLMDERRVPTILMDQKKESKNSFKTGLIIYGIMGIFIGLFIFIPLQLFLKMNIVTSMILFLLMTTMISDFSSVLLDLREKNILMTRPVDMKTLSAAKIIHIITYLFCIAMAIAGPSILFGLFRYGFVFALLFFLVIVLICGFLILFTALLYYAIISCFSGERLKDLINYFQIVLATVMTIMYQFVGRIFNISGLNVTVTPHLWHFLLPSAWFSAPFVLFIEQKFSAYYVSLSVLALIIPIITVTLYVKVVAPRFAPKLQKLEGSGPNKKKSWKEAFGKKIAALWCHNPIEKNFFTFTLQMLDNERKLKLKMYPSFAFALIFPFIMFMNFFGGGQSFREVLLEITNGRYFLFLYLSVSLLAPQWMLLSLSENYKGAWIYKVLPIDSPVHVIKGALKAILIKYIVPIYLLISILFVGIYGIKVVPSLILIFINLMLLMFVFFYYTKKELPFSKDFQYTQNDSNTVLMFMSFLLCGCLAGIHYLALRMPPYGVIVNIAVSLLVTMLLWKYSFRFTWREVKEGIHIL